MRVIKLEVFIHVNFDSQLDKYLTIFLFSFCVSVEMVLLLLRGRLLPPLPEKRAKESEEDPKNSRRGLAGKRAIFFLLDNFTDLKLQI